VEGKGVLDLSVRQGEDSLVVVLNNLTNPMMMKGPIREVYPTGPLTLSIAIPKGRAVQRVQLVAAGEDLAFEIADRRVRATIPELATLDAVQVDWS